MIENLLTANLPTSERSRLEPYLDRVMLKSADRLVTAGEPIEAVWFPDNCVTSTLVENEGGETIEVGLMGAEGMVGLSLLFGVENSNTTVICQVPGTAMRMTTENFNREVVQKRGPLFQQLLRYSNAFMGMIAQSAACNSLHPVEERFARWILMTQDRVQRDDFPLTQEFMSAMLGVRRPTVTLAASMLKRGGLIDYTRGSVKVMDRRGLEMASCECYAIITRQMKSVFDYRSD